jgi:hypothetical protein
MDSITSRQAALAAAGILFGLSVQPLTGADNWVLTGSLNVQRNAFTLTLLNDGRALAAGGSGSSSNLQSSETYNPASGTWSMAGNMATPRANQTATLLPSGKVLIAGGCSGYPCNGLTSSELFDPSSNQFSTTGFMITGRYGHQAVLLTDGRVLVMGGTSICNSSTCNPLDSAEIYDPASGSWSSVAPMPTARVGMAATAVGGDKALVTGGCPVSGGPCPNLGAIVFDAIANTWTGTGPMMVDRYSAAATLMPDGSVIAVGGLDSSGYSIASAERFTPATLAWSAAGTLKTARFEAAATLLQTGDLLVAGVEYRDIRSSHLGNHDLEPHGIDVGVPNRPTERLASERLCPDDGRSYRRPELDGRTLRAGCLATGEPGHLFPGLRAGAGGHGQHD